VRGFERATLDRFIRPLPFGVLGEWVAGRQLSLRPGACCDLLIKSLNATRARVDIIFVLATNNHCYNSEAPISIHPQTLLEAVWRNFTP
jgi:hypothetical protein